ncbi:MAG: hypothetical protein RL011_131 [Pseudomonadota bacterium]
MSTVRSIKGGAKAPKVIAVTSGKGGVGKTLTTVHLAVAAQRMGHSVLILDGDMGLANVDVVLGLQARYNIRDVLDGHVSLQDIILSGPLGIDVIPSGSGIASLTSLSYVQQQQIIDQIPSVNKTYDVLFIDTGAGIASNVTHFCSVADQVLVVTTPEPHALTDAYALIKVLAESHGVKRPHLMINQTRADSEGLKSASRITEVAMRFLDVKVSYAGNVPLDPQVNRSVMQRRAASEQSTYTISGQAWTQIARKLLGMSAPNQHADAQDFWRSLLRQEPVRVEGAK